MRCLNIEPSSQLVIYDISACKVLLLALQNDQQRSAAAAAAR